MSLIARSARSDKPAARKAMSRTSSFFRAATSSGGTAAAVGFSLLEEVHGGDAEEGGQRGQVLLGGVIASSRAQLPYIRGRDDALADSLVDGLGHLGRRIRSAVLRVDRPEQVIKPVRQQPSSRRRLLGHGNHQILSGLAADDQPEFICHRQVNLSCHPDGHRAPVPVRQTKWSVSGSGGPRRSVCGTTPPVSHGRERL